MADLFYFFFFFFFASCSLKKIIFFSFFLLVQLNLCSCKWTKKEKISFLIYFHTIYQQRENDGSKIVHLFMGFGLLLLVLEYGWEPLEYCRWQLTCGDSSERLDSGQKPGGLFFRVLGECGHKRGHTSPKAMLSQTPSTQQGLLAWRDQASG